jgi:predicted TIM-barrel fold metal-dependent hydrolase
MVGVGPSRRGGYDTKLNMKPTEYFQRQCYVTYIRDELGVRYRKDIGVDRIMWSSDYPHAASTWPKSAEFIDRDFAGGPETDKRMICHDNVAKLYGFEV